jgi:hypothetical protein
MISFAADCYGAGPGTILRAAPGFEAIQRGMELALLVLN